MKARRTREKPPVPTRSGPAPARLDRRTKDLTKRLSAGDIAVIKHSDIDRVSAEALVSCKPTAVINADKSISGRYPNLGPGIIVDAGIPLLDATGPEIFDSVEENAQISIVDDTVLLGEQEIATGIVQTSETIGKDMHEAEAGMNSVLVDFVDNTIEYIRKDSDLLSAELVVPEVATKFEGRHALIVVRGYHYKEDLAILGSYIREYRPLLVGVDGGADAIIEAGYKPDMIVGDMDSVSDTALTSGAEIVVHAYRDGNAPGTERVHSLGVDCVAFAASGTSEDIAMLLADDKGASLIVAVGTHDTVMEFLDKGRKGMASTFITRLRVGSKLIDAKGVSLLYRQRISSLQLSVLIIAGLVALGVALFATAAGQTLIGLIGAQLDGVFGWFGSLFGGEPAAPSESASIIQGLTSD
ncbi:MAG: putative cytokinetic ring protein SteA [Brevibacterium sp.]|nr:putative cytokinetic ring protein SteA [Brevibacterium sp.]MDN6175685.1 putative cytokinetic ring protein SteA [Brevibacterium sp.]MDN6188503.1 putative cytokinetic ring protein SteA [Brevibacterium sp.]